MKKKIIIILLLLTSCNSYELDLSIFNNQQKVILKNILEGNDNIFSNENNLSISDSYFNHLKKLKKSESPDDVLNNIFLKDNSYCEALRKSNIFILEKYKTLKSKKESTIYTLNYKSNYLDFLERISKNNDVILKYYNSIISSGGISPESNAIILHYLTKEDLKNENIRLIVGIHFLLINNS